MVSRLVFCLGLLPLAVYSSASFAADDGILQIMVSKGHQSIAVYRNGAEVAKSKVSTGKQGHATPTGIFSVLEKKKYHESNLYSNSPMPFMQRLTWSGIALHESKHVPAYPASHGCVRLPSAFARTLYDMTARGVHVVISEAPVVPMRIENPRLFKPVRPAPETLLLTDTALRPSQTILGNLPVEVASNEAAARQAAPARTEKAAATAPLRILITRRGDRERILDIQNLLNRLGFNAGEPDGVAGSNTQIAANAFRLAHSLPPGKSVLEAAFVKALYQAAGQDEPPVGHLMVRQNFRPLFEASIVIREPEKELGTHFLIAVDTDINAGTAQWTAVSLENNLTEATRKRLGITSLAAAPDMNAATSALDRIEIGTDLRERIERLMTPGTSLTITDNNISPETGKGTDFVTVTRETPVKPARPKT